VTATLIPHSAYTSSGYLQDPLVQAPAPRRPPRRPPSPHSSRTLIDTQSESTIAHDHHSTTRVPSPPGPRISLSALCHVAQAQRRHADANTSPAQPGYRGGQNSSRRGSRLASLSRCSLSPTTAKPNRRRCARLTPACAAMRTLCPRLRVPHRNRNEKSGLHASRDDGCGRGWRRRR
jgi:hypothetical protein